MQREVILREVGLRDGLQSISSFMPTADKLDWIGREAAAGVAEIEVTSYVPPKLLPQFADAEAVTAGALAVPGLTAAALVPNLRGAERGIELGVHKINFVMSVSETHNMKNVRRSREQSLAEFQAIAQRVRALPPGQRPVLCGGLATALGCTYEGKVQLSEVLRLAAALAQAGAQEIIIPDTVGYADPRLVRQVLRAVMQEVGPLPVAAHFHDTRGTGLANLLAALDCGVTHFDASLAGLGGCPFAPGATGNIVMEDACYMLESMGVATGIDLPALLAVRQVLERALPGVALHGALARAGLPLGYAGASQALAA
ncbi:hydroxymethylglutaryl-CoA lyase [Orrella sp. JC864]|uniref:hydroxymethylglutaryl-CoA lyase n=1 Tax=Orrella sp. JC864 TaxID=3120298 RepID=UPI0012BD269F